MSIQRPDKGPSGPTNGRTFLVTSLGEYSMQLYPNFKHLALRILLIRANRWYGSLLEMHIGERGKGFEVDYFDMLFMRCILNQWKENAAKKKKVVKEKAPSKVLDTILLPWTTIDSTLKSIVEWEGWTQLNDAVPTAKTIRESQKVQNRSK